MTRGINRNAGRYHTVVAERYERVVQHDAIVIYKAIFAYAYIFSVIAVKRRVEKGGWVAFAEKLADDCAHRKLNPTYPPN